MLFLTVTLILMRLSFAQPHPPPEPDLITLARGQALAREACGVCHAVERSGASPDVEAPPLRDLQRLDPLLFEPQGHTLRMTEGHPVMPDIILSEQQRVDLIAYIRDLQQTDEDAFR
ncbi:cytochrome c [Brevundimonas sp. 2R-24]|uniref:Cytochrome c n=1 Tax=Peiella sedimenti TaxID=3061083 RepID=A0ABT8SNR0_9CAUL|nr:cytochrome c [Caulobacteraceae bacterium XZ-24]